MANINFISNIANSRPILFMGHLGKGIMKHGAKAWKGSKIYAGAAGVTFGARLLSNQPLFKKKDGKRDILPFIPGI